MKIRDMLFKNSIREYKNRYFVDVSFFNYYDYGNPVYEYYTLNQTIDRFINTMNKKCKYFNTENFIKNIKQFKFVNTSMKYEDIYIDEDDINFDEKILTNCEYTYDDAGTYDPTPKIIYYDSTNSLLHELMHLAGKYSEYKSGFTIEYSNLRGVAIDEGYVEILLSKYFKDYELTEGYRFEIFVAKHIENIIGQNIMENLYFENGYRGLVEKLSKYAEPNEIYKFLDAVDTINNNDLFCGGEFTEDEYLMYKELIDLVFKFIQQLIIRKTEIENVGNNEFNKLFDEELWLKELDTYYFELYDEKMHDDVINFSDKSTYRYLRKKVLKKGINQ